MPFDRPTIYDLRNRITADFQSRVTSGHSVLRRSIIKVFSFVWAGCCHLMYGFIDLARRQLFASTADSNMLDQHATEWGFVRVEAQFATGTAYFTGAHGSVVPEGTKAYRQSDNAIYLLQADVTLNSVTVDGSGNYRGSGVLLASSTGAAYNDDGGAELTLISSIAGVDSTVTMDGDGLHNGSDRETDDSLRKRILRRKRMPPHGGAKHDFESWALEVAGVTRAWCTPNYLNQVGAVSLAFVRDGERTGKILPSAAQRKAVKDYIIEHQDPATGDTVGIPVTAEAGFDVPALSWQEIDFDFSISPNTDVVQAAITAEVTDLVKREGGPAQTLKLSDVEDAVRYAGESETPEGDDFQFEIIYPTGDITTSFVNVHQATSFNYRGI